MTVNLLEFEKHEFVQLCTEMGEKPFRARQLMHWIHQSGAGDFDAMTDISKLLRERLKVAAEIRAPRTVRDTTAADGTRKWLLDVGTGNAVEAVFIPEPARVERSGDATPRPEGSASSVTRNSLIKGTSPLENPLKSERSEQEERLVQSFPSGILPADGVNSEGSLAARRRKRGTLCISSQAGCALACTFCSTGRQGFNRNLTVAEIIGQLWIANRGLGRGATAPRPISNVVMMGMGEPLANFDNVVAAMRLMLDDDAYGLSRRRVTLSTSGLVPAIDRLRDRCPVALAVSLHAPTDALRNELVPINKKYPLKELLAACLRYIEKAPRDFVTFEYVMLDGVNDSVAQAQQLVKLVQSVPCKINLIPFNPFPQSGYQRSSTDAVSRFRDVLMQAGLTVTVRKTRGHDIDAACGQLAGQVQDKTRRRERMHLTTAATVATATL